MFTSEARDDRSIHVCAWEIFLIAAGLYSFLSNGRRTRPKLLRWIRTSILEPAQTGCSDNDAPVRNKNMSCVSYGYDRRGSPLVAGCALILSARFVELVRACISSCSPFCLLLLSPRSTSTCRETIPTNSKTILFYGYGYTCVSWR